ncbi:DUF308 domain-containing protein [Brevibacillus fluminis]|uniref:DUF308 domain-containing protein n=1 Tax=Brevibacillus fluminis TaxID=511487 RepID=A0A3M8CVF2_9BACL|nr:DUF308 domain-containing protein [Brevibacillus fluminis]RNB79724.1 DUF308 domain-containing protein [Brevibacillus fluminis]
MSASQGAGSRQTIVGLSALIRILLHVGSPVLGLGVGYVIPHVAKWALKLPWVPFQGPLQLIASFHGAWVGIVFGLLGVVAGIWFAHEAIKESLCVTVTDHDVQLDKDGTRQSIAKQDIRLAFIDGKQLVLLATSGQELVRETHESTAAVIAQAFNQHGYQWSDVGDPYKTQYRRWVPDTPDLPQAVNALLMAREKALSKNEKADAKDLHNEVGRFGYIVRDEGVRQYWRAVESV